MTVQPTIREWHAQFLRQAQWTQATRSQLYRRARLLQAKLVLDVGCGTGVITRELARRTHGEVIGIDADPEMIAFAWRQDDPADYGRDVRYEQADAQALPYPDNHFDVVTCHFVLMWLSDPERAVREMARVVRTDGAVLVCAEPDYGGRLDWPDLPVREWQIDGLRRQGANPLIGRQLLRLLVSAGLDADVGIIPSSWDTRALQEQGQEEWKWLAYDVGDTIDQTTLAQAQARARAAIEAGTRLVYVPVFYAIGWRRGR